MKKVLLPILIVTSLTVYSQETNKDKEQTKSEKFSQRSGTLLQKDFIDLGQVSGIDVKILKITDLNDNESNTSVRFEYRTYADIFINAIDKDEVDGLIISIKNLLNLVSKTTPTNYTEVTYFSRGGFTLGIYFETQKSKWKSFLKIDKNNSKSTIILTETDLQNLLSLLEKTKERI